MQYDSTFEAFEANGAIACPLCGKQDWCYLKSNAKGIVFWAVCGRLAGEPPAGWERIGTSKGSDRRGIYQLIGISHRRRKFPQDFRLLPRKFENSPEWKKVERDSDTAIVVGDRVLLDREICTVERISRSAKRQTFVFELSNGHTTDEGLVTYADHDPVSGAHEREIVYVYGPQHKVMRAEWTDRRPWYDGKTKKVRPWHALRGEDGQWIWKLGRGPDRWPVYQEDEALDAIAAGKPLFVVGGEACVEKVRGLGFAATCCQGGEGRWLDIFEAVKEPLQNAFMAGKKPVIILWPDNDPTGESALLDLHRRLIGELRARACLLNPLALWPKMPAGGDVVDWLAAHEHLLDDEILQQLQKAVDRAIDQAELRIEAEERAETWGAPTTHRGELGYWRIKNKEDEGAVWQPRCNFDFQICQEISGEDGGGFVLAMKLVDKSGERRCRVMAADCESKSKFQRAISKSIGSPVICKLKDEEVQALLRVRMLEYSQIQGGKTYKLCKKMGCQGENPDGSGTWVIGNTQLSESGQPTNPDLTGWCWDESINDGGESIKMPIVLPHDPQAIKRLAAAAQVFFGDSWPRCLLMMGWAAATIHYSEVMKVFDAFPIPNPFGDPGGGKTEAAKCGMALAGNHRAGDASELSRSGLYELLKISGNLPLLLDDPEESADMNELLKRLYNAKARIVRGDGKRFSSQKPSTSIAVSTNAAIGENQAATQSRLVKIFFPSPIAGGTQNTESYEELQAAMDGAAAALPDLIRLGLLKNRIKELTIALQPHLAAAHNRIARSFALYLAYAEQIQRLADCTELNLLQWVILNVCPTLNTTEESGDSVRDFLQRVFNLMSESKVGPWNCKVIRHRDGTKSLAIHIPSVWDAVKSQAGLSYNATALKGALDNRGIKLGMARFHQDKQTSTEYQRMLLKLRFEGHPESSAPQCPMVRRKCHILPWEFMQKYAENNEDMFLPVDSVDSVDSQPESLAQPDKSESTFSLIESTLQVDSVDTPSPQSNKTDMSTSVSTFSQVDSELESTNLVDRVNPDTASLSAEKTPLSTESTEKRSRSGEKTEKLLSTVTRVGDFVLINASAHRWRSGSDRLTVDRAHAWVNQRAKLHLDELAQANRSVWLELQKPLEVVKVRSGRMTVITAESKTLHCFLLDDCVLYRRATLNQEVG